MTMTMDMTPDMIARIHPDHTITWNEIRATGACYEGRREVLRALGHRTVKELGPDTPVPVRDVLTAAARGNVAWIYVLFAMAQRDDPVAAVLRADDQEHHARTRDADARYYAAIGIDQSAAWHRRRARQARAAEPPRRMYTQHLPAARFATILSRPPDDPPRKLRPPKGANT